MNEGRKKERKERRKEGRKERRKEGKKERRKERRKRWRDKNCVLHNSLNWREKKRIEIHFTALRVLPTGHL